ncbi:CDP-alcohol phosphatidyltransferase family protein [Thermaurantiacus sp.]
MLLPVAENARPPEIELPSNRWLIHRLSGWLLPRAVRAGVPADAASLLGLAFGLLAAAAFLHGEQPAAVAMGWLLLLAWLVMDGLDGAIARATGTASPAGRFLDGYADYGVFVAVYAAFLVAGERLELVPLAIAAGIAHALQAACYEALRETYRRRLSGTFEVTERPVAGGLLERVYNRVEDWAGRRATGLDARLAGSPPEVRAAMLARWRARAAPLLRTLGLLSANARVHAIALAALAGAPALFWWWELLGLSAVALLGRWLWQQLETAAAGA